MACCIIAAYLLAQLVTVVRRWAIFWGLLRPQDGEQAATLLGWLRGTNPARLRHHKDW